jgi:hypothetical protein
MRHKPTVFEQIVERFPWTDFDRLAREHGADDRARGFDSRDHFLALLAGSLGGLQGLRPLTATLAPNNGALRLPGGKAPARSTLGEANRNRPSEFFVALLHRLIARARGRVLRRELRSAVRSIDATHIDLGPRMKRWFAMFKGREAAKIHVVYDPATQRPVYFELTGARTPDISAAKDLLPIEAGATYVFDLGYYDYGWWEKLAAKSCIFVTRLKSNTPLRDAEAREVPPGGSVLSDREGYLPERLSHARRNPFGRKGREIAVRIDNGKILRLFTNDPTSSAEEIAALYKERWQIELFFKWIKQNLKIEHFMGTSENAIRIQIAVAFIAYLLLLLTHDGQSSNGQTKVPPPSALLLLVEKHLFVRRPIPELLGPGAPPPVAPPGPLLLLIEGK